MKVEIEIPKTQEDIDDNKTLYNWDLEIRGKKYDVYLISGFYHSIGRDFNDLYCCPMGEPPTLKNIISFCGNHAPRWEISWNIKHYTKNKWNETSIEFNGIWTIYRNGIEFITGGARTMSYGLAKAQTVLVELQEHSIPFHFRNWRDEVLNRKIWYHNQPGIITSIIEGGQLCVMISPHGISEFEPPAHLRDADWWNEDDVIHKTSMLDHNINWFRME